MIMVGPEAPPVENICIKTTTVASSSGSGTTGREVSGKAVRRASHLDVFDLQAAQLLQGHARVLPQEADAVLQPADGGDGVPGRLALEQGHAVRPQRLVGRALADDGWRPVCEH